MQIAMLTRMRATSPSLLRGLAILFLAASIFVHARADDDYAKSVEAWRTARVARLTKPDGWLTLIGLHWLRPGENRIGTAPDNNIMFAAGPAYFGTVDVAPGRVLFKPAPTANALVDGLPANDTELRYGTEVRPSLVRSGTVGFFVIERNGNLALRVKDSEARRRRNFVGLDYFPIDPSWRIEAKWVQFDQPQQVSFTDVLGHTSPAPVPGKAVFTRNGHTLELLPIDEGADNPLFFVLSDQTTGGETYGGGRFLYTDWPKDGKVILDFNHMENPPCAFTPFSTCPLAPKGNQLPFPVNAGEKTYRGEHH